METTARWLENLGRERDLGGKGALGKRLTELGEMSKRGNEQAGTEPGGGHRQYR